MAKPEWGTKRQCQSCGAKYYDFHRSPIACPACGATFDPEAILKARRSRPAPAPKKALAAAAAVVIDEDLPDVAADDVPPGEEDLDAVVEDDAAEEADDVDLEDEEDDSLLEDTSDLDEGDEDVDGLVEGEEEEER